LFLSTIHEGDIVETSCQLGCIGMRKKQAFNFAIGVATKATLSKFINQGLNQ
jgi:hypothetical protein